MPRREVDAESRRNYRAAQSKGNAMAYPAVMESQPDNTSEGLRSLLEANEGWRRSPWPVPYEHTRHVVRIGDARDHAWLLDASVP